MEVSKEDFEAAHRTIRTLSSRSPLKAAIRDSRYSFAFTAFVYLCYAFHKHVSFHFIFHQQRKIVRGYLQQYPHDLLVRAQADEVGVRYSDLSMYEEAL